MPPFPPWFIEFTNIVNNWAVTIAAIVGIVGLWQWRNELIGKTKFELAKKIMMLTLQFRDEFKTARNAITIPDESAGRKTAENESQDEKQVLDEYYVHWQRLIPLQDTLRKFSEVSWEAEIILSQKDADLIEPFEKLFGDLNSSIKIYFDAQLRLIKNPNLAPMLTPLIDSSFKTVYGTKDDELSKSVDDATNAVKKQLKKYVH